MAEGLPGTQFVQRHQANTLNRRPVGFGGDMADDLPGQGHVEVGSQDLTGQEFQWQPGLPIGRAILGGQAVRPAIGAAE
ncbi:MAG: hypothetical protein IPN59_12665 [Holophaga sp.]|nr:hypothetical protein [Holophaga sp.]